MNAYKGPNEAQKTLGGCLDDQRVPGMPCEVLIVVMFLFTMQMPQKKMEK